MLEVRVPSAVPELDFDSLNANLAVDFLHADASRLLVGGRGQGLLA